MREAIFSISEEEFVNPGEEAIKVAMSKNAEELGLKNFVITRDNKNVNGRYVYRITGE